ncbi:hypothetical protein [Paracoccus aestuarii]|uniref:hypothetical protein n=1 Tax=Paracoccus aestuarii TaxID=453842 RepID=UPI0014743564|nr:hypothetical protein [Paracoccus aestuarii]WCQ99567.1 hypothetical protein JHW48_02125 [Paracoccus aestuarii]
MTYDEQCAAGRDQAAYAIQEYQQTEDAPKLVQAIRKASVDETGFGAGFLFAVAARVA